MPLDCDSNLHPRSTPLAVEKHSIRVYLINRNAFRRPPWPAFSWSDSCIQHSSHFTDILCYDTIQLTFSLALCRTKKHHPSTSRRNYPLPHRCPFLFCLSVFYVNIAVQHKMIQIVRLVAEGSARAARPGDRPVRTTRASGKKALHDNAFSADGPPGVAPDILRLRGLSVRTSRLSGPNVRAARPDSPYRYQS